MADEIRNCGELDEHLTPFVDGEEPPAGRAAVAAHLAKCPPCREHADAERQARDLIHAQRQVLYVRAPGALRERCAAAAARSAPSAGLSTFLWRWAPLSLAATLVLAVAGVFVFGLNNRVEALAASLTADHVKCFSIGEVDPATDAAAAGRKWQQDYGWPVAIAPAASTEQLRLIDVRRCFSTDGRTAHLMYRWRGEPLSLYVLPHDTGRARVVRKMGHQTVIWCANQRTYAVVADAQSAADLSRVVEYLKANTR
jgi:anti-sigma factor RsiW